MAYTYTGASGSPQYLLTMYLNGVAYRSVSVPLAVKRTTNPLIGGWNDSPGAFALAQFRIHDGAMTSDQVAYNYNSFASGFIATQTPTQTSTPSPSGTQLYSFSSTPSPSVTPTGTPCPTSFGFTHTLRSVSFIPSSDSTAYLRHCNAWLYATPNYIASTNGNAVSTEDATEVLRYGLDGLGTGVSIQATTTNYQG